MSWIIAVLIGIGFGGVVGLICGLMIGDNYWKTKLCPYCDHDYQKYKEKQQMEAKHDQIGNKGNY